MKAYAVRVHRTIAKSLILAAVVCAAGPARADIVGATGTLVGIVLTEFTSNVVNYRGKIVVQEEDMVLREYLWAGTRCSGRNVTENDVNILARVVGSRTVQITPYYKTATLGIRCLVSFLIADPEVIEDIGQ